MRKFPPTDLQRARAYTVTVVMLARIPDGRPVQNQTKKKVLKDNRMNLIRMKKLVRGSFNFLGESENKTKMTMVKLIGLSFNSVQSDQMQR